MKKLGRGCNQANWLNVRERGKKRRKRKKHKREEIGEAATRWELSIRTDSKMRMK